MMPLSVSEAAPPIDALLARIIGLDKVSVVVLEKRAPAPPTPAPLIVMLFVLPKVAVAKLVLSEAPFATVVLIDCAPIVPKAFTFVRASVPALIVVIPV